MALREVLSGTWPVATTSRRTFRADRQASARPRAVSVRPTVRCAGCTSSVNVPRAMTRPPERICDDAGSGDRRGDPGRGLMPAERDPRAPPADRDVADGEVGQLGARVEDGLAVGVCARNAKSGRDVVAGAAEHVGVDRAVDAVIAGAGLDAVVARVGAQDVVAVAAGQEVVAGAAADVVCRGVAREGIGALTADHGAGRRVVALPGRAVVGDAVERDRHAGRPRHIGSRGAIALQHVGSLAAVELRGSVGPQACRCRARRARSRRRRRGSA